MVALSKTLVGVSGCAMLLVFSPSPTPIENYDIAGQGNSKMVSESELRQSGWNIVGNSMHAVPRQVGVTSESHERGIFGYGQLRGTLSSALDPQQSQASIGCAAVVAICFLFISWIIAWTWGGEQIDLLCALISREVFDAMLALTAFLPTLEARFVEIVAAILISLVGVLAGIGHLSCSPRRWILACKAFLFLLIGLGLGLPHFWKDMSDIWPSQLCGLLAAILVHVVPIRIIAADWSFIARHIRRLWSASCIVAQRCLSACHRLSQRRCRSNVARAKAQVVQKKGVSSSRDKSCRHSAPISRRGAIATACKVVTSTQSSHDNVRAVETGTQKFTAAPVVHTAGRRSPRAPAQEKRRSIDAVQAPQLEARRERRSSLGTRKENIPVEVKRNCATSDAHKENIPSEMRKENVPLDAQKTRPNAAVLNRGSAGTQNAARQSLQGLAAANVGGVSPKGVTTICSSKFPIFVDEEFAEAAPEPPDMLCARQEHEAIIDTLSKRLASIRAFKTHWTAGDTSKALPALSSGASCWAHRDIDKIRLLLENVNSPTEATKAEALCKMRAGVNAIFASTQ